MKLLALGLLACCCPCADRHPYPVCAPQHVEVRIDGQDVGSVLMPTIWDEEEAKVGWKTWNSINGKTDPSRFVKEGKWVCFDTTYTEPSDQSWDAFEVKCVRMKDEK